MSRHSSHRTAAIVCGTIVFLALLGTAIYLTTHGHAKDVGLAVIVLFVIFVIRFL